MNSLLPLTDVILRKMLNQITVSCSFLLTAYLNTDSILEKILV